MTAARMRTIKEAIAEIKTADPRSSLTEWALRQLIINGKIPYVTVGNKYLLNLDILEAYLDGQTVQPAEKQTGAVWRIG